MIDHHLLFLKAVAKELVLGVEDQFDFRFRSGRGGWRRCRRDCAKFQGETVFFRLKCDDGGNGAARGAPQFAKLDHFGNMRDFASGAQGNGNCCRSDQAASIVAAVSVGRPWVAPSSRA